MFRPFLVAIIRLYIHSFKITYNMPTRLCSVMRPVITMYNVLLLYIVHYDDYVR
jgi:hypothetical protein